MTATCFPLGFPRQAWTDFCPTNWRERPIVPRCVNSERGTFGHECGRDATVIGTHVDGQESCYCERCATHGTEVRRAVALRPLGSGSPPSRRP